MTAHCRPEKYPEDEDWNEAAEIVALAIDPAIPYTKTVKMVAQRLQAWRTDENQDRS